MLNNHEAESLLTFALGVGVEEWQSVGRHDQDSCHLSLLLEGTIGVIAIFHSKRTYSRKEPWLEDKDNNMVDCTFNIRTREPSRNATSIKPHKPRALRRNSS